MRATELQQGLDSSKEQLQQEIERLSSGSQEVATTLAERTRQHQAECVWLKIASSSVKICSRC